MRACVGGAVVGFLVAVLILAVGLTVAAYVAIGVATAAIVVGAVDYVREHPHGRHG